MFLKDLVKNSETTVSSVTMLKITIKEIQTFRVRSKICLELNIIALITKIPVPLGFKWVAVNGVIIKSRLTQIYLSGNKSVISTAMECTILI